MDPNYLSKKCKKGLTQRFPDFGKELKRPYEVHERCYDCDTFLFEDCPAIPANCQWDCKDQKVTIIYPGPTDWHKWVYGGQSNPNS